MQEEQILQYTQRSETRLLIGSNNSEIKTHTLVTMRRQEPLKKILMLGKIESNRKIGRQKIRWLDTITDAMNMKLEKLKQMINST